MDNDQISHCNLFNKDKQEELFQFLHACIDEICNGTGPIFRQFTNVDWTKEEFNSIRKRILSLLQIPSCLLFDDSKMPLEYHEYPEHVQQAFLTCLRIRKNQLTNALLYKYSSKHVPTLLDFDWRLKYIMGSSKMASIKEPLMQLDFILKEKQKDEILQLEFNKDELDSLINTIESIIT